MFVVLFSGIAMLPIGVSLKESLWIARRMWYTPTVSPQSVLPKIELNIDYDDYRTLGATRVKALEVGALLDSIQEFVPATITYQGVKLNAVVKLKGMRPTHWKHPIKWSFRIVIQEGKEIVSNMKIFSLQAPEQRGYYVDALYHDFLRKAGLINLQYDFVDLELKGTNLGMYMIEEFFDISLLKRLGKPNGPIIKFDYESFWEGMEWNNPGLPGLRDSLAATYQRAPIKSYKYGSGTYQEWKNDSKNGRKLLDGFRKKELSVAEVFNVPAFARYFAVNTLFGNQHPALLTNQRFYYNPTIKRLEPVGYDIEGIYSIERDTAFEFTYLPFNKSRRTVFIDQVFSDIDFKDAFLEALDFVTDSAFIGEVLTDFQPIYDQIYREFPGLSDRRELIKENATIYRNLFDFKMPRKSTVKEDL